MRSPSAARRPVRTAAPYAAVPSLRRRESAASPGQDRPAVPSREPSSTRSHLEALPAPRRVALDQREVLLQDRCLVRRQARRPTARGGTRASLTTLLAEVPGAPRCWRPPDCLCWGGLSSPSVPSPPTWRELALALVVALAVFAWPLRTGLFDPSRILCGVDTAVSQLPWSQAPGGTMRSRSRSADRHGFYPPFSRTRVEPAGPPLWNPVLTPARPRSERIPDCSTRRSIADRGGRVLGRRFD